jgi:hypothetical protein
LATNNKSFVVRNGLTVGGASGTIDVIDAEGNWIGATGTLTGASGVQGASGSAGINGATGSAGSNGTNGATGPSGVNGATGSAGTNGATGASGINGATGSTGLSGVNGASGVQGASGSQGVQGASGATGFQGASGSTGPTGASGINGNIYNTTSTSSLTLAASGATGITVGTYLDYTVGQSIIIAYDYNNHQHAQVVTYNEVTGAMQINRTSVQGSGTYTSWVINLDGAVGVAGATGSPGVGGTIAYYGDFYSTSVLGATGGANIDYVIPIDSTRANYGITIENNGNSIPTRITFSEDGTYQITISAQILNVGNNIANANIFMKKNGVTVLNSNFQAAIPKKDGPVAGQNTLARQFIVPYVAGDYVEFWANFADVDLKLESLAGVGATGASGAMPASPAIEIGVSQVTYTLIGASGFTGATGSAGTNGATGSAGTNGAQGIQGASGSTGPTGATGASGSAGTNGATGAQGIQGASGSTGPTGATGASPAVTTYTANTASLTNGANASGSVTDIQSFNDGNSYAWTDGTGSGPAWIFDVGFTGVSKFNLIDLNVNYTTASGHTVYVQLYNNTTSSWDSIGSYNGLAGYYQFEMSVISSTPYINSGAVSLRLYHSNTGNAGHQTYLDYVALVDSIQGGQGPIGRTGATGVSGATGTAGTNGATGSAGTNGIDGASGATGINGATGATGAAGTNGATGATGVNGATGATGVGINGASGVNGATGPAGANGASGINGASGFVGSNGATGIIGGVSTVGASGSYYPVLAGSTGPLSNAYLNTSYTFNPGTGVFAAPFVSATGTITGSNNYGAISYGTLNYSDVNMLASFASSVNTYNQILLQNQSNGTQASTNFVVSNDIATNSTNYAEFGINSSGFNGGTDCEFHHSNTAYLAAQSVDLAIGTYGTNNVHFIVNNSVIESMSILANNSIQINAPVKVTTGATGYSGATGAVGAPTGYFNTLYVNGTAVTGGAAGASITDDTTTNASYYPAMYSVTTGTPSTVYTSSSKIYFNPSTGTLNSTIYNSLSDENKKKNIKTIDNALDTVNQLNGVEFDWKDNDVKSYGVIAQEIEKVLPHLVTMDDQGNKSVNYNGLFGFLINAIKEQQKQIDDLKLNK